MFLLTVPKVKVSLCSRMVSVFVILLYNKLYHLVNVTDVLTYKQYFSFVLLLVCDKTSTLDNPVTLLKSAIHINLPLHVFKMS